jgi:hypothetical protein
MVPDGKACGIIGAVAYKRTEIGYKRKMRHTASMRDCEVPHGNIDFVTDPISEPVTGHTALLKAVPNRPVFHP